MYEASPIVNAGSRKWNAIRNANWSRDRKTGSSSMVFPDSLPRCALVRELPGKPAIGREPPRCDLTLLGCAGDGAIRPAQVAAITEAALPEPGPEFHERLRSIFGGEVMQSEFLQPGRVDDG